MEPGISVVALDPDAEERFVPLRRMLGVTTFGLNQMILRPGQRGRIHRHTHQEEVYVVLEGTLTLLADDGFSQELGPGAVVRVAPDVKRQLVNRHPAKLVMLAMGGAHEHAGRDGEVFNAFDQDVAGTPQETPLPDDVPVLED